MKHLLPAFNSTVRAFAILVGISGPLAVDARDLAELYGELAEATPETADYIEGEIRSEWSRSGSAAMDLLLKRGVDALEVGDTSAAIGHLTALTDHAPDFTEGYATRAGAYFAAGLYGPALADLELVLARDPKHFGAMEGLAIILYETGREEESREVWEKVIEVHPNSASAKEALEWLQVETKGRDA